MAIIYCFSSTGNSLYIAKKLAEKLPGDLRSMTSETAVAEDQVIGLVFPAYYWTMPLTVREFIARLHVVAEQPYIFSVVCYGGKALGVSGFVAEALRAKGLNLAYSEKIKSVENYLPMFSVSDSTAIHVGVDEEINRIAQEIRLGQSKAPEAITSEVQAVAQDFLLENGRCDRHFIINQSCTGCGACSRLCPRGNIVVGDCGKPIFQGNCEHCLGCLHACPVEALDWTELTKGKARYRHPQIKGSELAGFLHS